MEICISTSDTHPRDRFEYWLESSRALFGRYEATAIDPVGFQADLRAIGGTGMLLSVVRASGMTAWRTRQQASRLPDSVYILLQSRGQLKVLQHGREALLNPFDFAVIDTSRASAIAHSERGEGMLIELPRREFEARLGSVKEWTARTVDGSKGAGALASSFARALPVHVKHLSVPAQAHVALQLIDLTSLALKEQGGAAFAHSSARLASLLRLKAVVEANLTNSGATCASIAAEAGISPRYANQLLDAEETSLERLLFSRRLAKCEATLADPVQMHRPISDVAFSWGFSDMSHFGRLLKAATGLSPRDYRRRALAAATKKVRSQLP